MTTIMTMIRRRRSQTVSKTLKKSSTPTKTKRTVRRSQKKKMIRNNVAKRVRIRGRKVRMLKSRLKVGRKMMLQNQRREIRRSQKILGMTVS